MWTLVTRHVDAEQPNELDIDTCLLHDFATGSMLRMLTEVLKATRDAPVAVPGIMTSLCEQDLAIALDEDIGGRALLNQLPQWAMVRTRWHSV